MTNLTRHKVKGLCGTYTEGDSKTRTVMRVGFTKGVREKEKIEETRFGWLKTSIPGPSYRRVSREGFRGRGTLFDWGNPN